MTEIQSHVRLHRVRKPIGRLSDALIRNLKTPEKTYKEPDGNSLYLLLTPTGLRSWRWDYRFRGAAKTFSIGRFPDVGLAQARTARDEARRKVLSGVDPMEERRETKQASLIAHENSFESVARAWYEVWSIGRHPRYTKDVMSRFERNVFPAIGHKPVSQIEAPDLVRMMTKIQGRGATDIALRARNTSSQVFRYAIAHGLARRNPAVDFCPSDVLPRRSVRNHARIDENELPDLLRKIEAYQGTPTTRFAIKLLALTFVRTSELIEAEWSEFDLVKGEWRIPGERMKMGRTHVVPLARQALEILKTLRLISGNSQWLFPGERSNKKPMSNNTILKALDRMGYKGRMTGHGFRGLASTHLYAMQFPGDHIELQLAHTREKVRGAYDHSEQMPQRRKMMDYWAAYLDGCLTRV
ncbi:tyrosine-type recombinase/integrase [Caenimonas sp. SL110]|uniref:tyrosine-type recombinase/integrase n=1 Tax=Caenimonas sp. SL110 TaxID=1450524 RepID=UPI0006540EAC|nr:tyrosine-type recombinase/integrase [Caenimonas sp. SL110]